MVGAKKWQVVVVAYLTVSNLSKRFGASSVVQDVQFTVSQGEVLGIVGPNGAGKSTTLQMIASTLPVSSGTIVINGYDTAEAPLQARASVGYAPQEPPLYDEMTVGEFLRFVAELQGISKKQRGAALTRVLTQCALHSVDRSLCGHLSVGFRKRVGLAAALIHSPGLLLLDEPCAGLDPIQRAHFRHLIETLRPSHAIVLSTHLLSEVVESCNRVLVMSKGGVLKDFDLRSGARQDLEAEFMRIVRGAASPVEEDQKKVANL